MTSSHTPLLGVVVPTLGRRVQYLRKCLEALQSESIYIVIVGPKSVETILKHEQIPVDVFVEERAGDPLALSINRAVEVIPDSVKFITWVGDDDVLFANSILPLLSAAEDHSEVVCIYGDCDYIEEHDRVIWRNRPQKFASKLISILPQRISQPASVISHTAWKNVKGLEPNFRLTFDYDLFIRLAKVGRLEYHPYVIAQYRWHPDALSVKLRKISVLEASRVRQSNRNLVSRMLWTPFEFLLILSTYWFGIWMSIKLKAQQ